MRALICSRVRMHMRTCAWHAWIGVRALESIADIGTGRRRLGHHRGACTCAREGPHPTPPHARTHMHPTHVAHVTHATGTQALKAEVEEERNRAEAIAAAKEVRACAAKEGLCVRVRAIR